jgi:hypothetical protein
MLDWLILQTQGDGVDAAQPLIELNNRDKGNNSNAIVVGSIICFLEFPQLLMQPPRRTITELVMDYSKIITMKANDYIHILKKKLHLRKCLRRKKK